MSAGVWPPLLRYASLQALPRHLFGDDDVDLPDCPGSRRLSSAVSSDTDVDVASLPSEVTDRRQLLFSSTDGDIGLQKHVSKPSSNQMSVNQNQNQNFTLGGSLTKLNLSVLRKSSTSSYSGQWMQLNDLDFADDLALLSHTQQQMQKTTSVAAGVSMYTKGKARFSDSTQHAPIQSQLTEELWRMNAVVALPILAFMSASEPPCSSMMLPRIKSVDRFHLAAMPSTPSALEVPVIESMSSHLRNEGEENRE
ncbi:unnamed protein product [Schistosoma margrebowiei]|uniref:Uncharacterized protein n=1 Tax=Schistosoma margrebowiei TaxID=48269 RepID=A0A183M7B6_9TREM|nr:unnamed protein product [Schistosoma margrebowiei]